MKVWWNLKDRISDIWSLHSYSRVSEDEIRNTMIERELSFMTAAAMGEHFPLGFNKCLRCCGGEGNRKCTLS